MNILLLSLVSISLSVAAQFLLKRGMGLVAQRSDEAALQSWFDQALMIATNRHVLAGFVLYGLGAVLWLGVLRSWDVSKAYPLVGIGFVLTLLIGWMIGERVTVERMIGVALISAGVFVVARG